MKKLSFKNLPKFATLLVLSFLVLTGCEEDNETDVAQSSITDDETQMIITSTMAGEGGEIPEIKTTTAAREQAKSLDEFTPLEDLSCNESLSISWSDQDQVGERSWSFQNDWTWKLICDFQNIEGEYQVNGTGTLDFQGPNLIKQVDKTRDFDLSGFGPSSSVWTYQADHERNANYQFLVGNQNTIDVNIDLLAEDVLIDKQTQLITSGTYTIDITRTNSNGNVNSRGAVLVFNGDQTATVTLDNGATFNISW